MSSTDWMRDGRDEWDDDEEPRPPRCKFCGSTDVRWRQQTGKWVLFSKEPGKLHVCPIEDDFGTVPG